MVTFCISCWPPERGTSGLLCSLACMLTCPWFLFNSHEAMTRNKAERETQTKKGRKKNGLGSRTRVPSSPKKLGAVIIQRRLNVMDAYGSVLHPDSAYLPARVRTKGHGWKCPILPCLTGQKWRMAAIAERRLRLNTVQGNEGEYFPDNDC